MNLRRLASLLSILSMAFIWCGCERDTVSSPVSSVSTCNYFPMDLQRTWTYDGFVEVRDGDIVVSQDFTETYAVLGASEMYDRDCIEFEVETSFDPETRYSVYYYTEGNALYYADMDIWGWRLVLDFDVVVNHSTGDTLNAADLDTTAAQYQILILIANQDTVTLETRTFEMCVGSRRETHYESGGLDISTVFFSYDVGMVYYEYLHYEDEAQELPNLTRRGVLTSWSSME